MGDNVRLSSELEDILDSAVDPATKINRKTDELRKQDSFKNTITLVCSIIAAIGSVICTVLAIYDHF